MWPILLQILAGWAEKLGLQWLQNHKEQKAKNDQNAIDKLSPDDVKRKLYEDYGRK